ncbi:MAG: hypothetical protein HKN25_16000 [Pyrinomonadaceae bacterium]|nr:hypothetical protein [Pyrinomonadaceae bacterium]
MKVIAKIREKMGDEWLPNVYATKVRSQRTRSYEIDLPKKQNSALIQHTLLGIELKVGHKRFACPDLSTARYLQVFAWIGCKSFAIPYDISKISTIADELESSWHRSLLYAEEVSKGKSNPVRGRIRSAMVKKIRWEIEEIGAGEAIPKFRKSTKQRKYSS